MCNNYFCYDSAIISIIRIMIPVAPDLDYFIQITKLPKHKIRKITDVVVDYHATIEL